MVKAMAGITDQPPIWQSRAQPTEEAQRASGRLRLLTRCIWMLIVVVWLLLVTVVLQRRENVALRVEREAAKLKVEQTEAHLRRVLARRESKAMGEVDLAVCSEKGPAKTGLDGGWTVDAFMEHMASQRRKLDQKEREVQEREALLGDVHDQLEELRRAVGEVERVVDEAMAEVGEEEDAWREMEQARTVDLGGEQSVVGLVQAVVVGGEASSKEQGEANATAGVRRWTRAAAPQCEGAGRVEAAEDEGLRTLAVGVKRWRLQVDKGVRGYAEMDLGTW